MYVFKLLKSVQQKTKNRLETIVSKNVFRGNRATSKTLRRKILKYNSCEYATYKEKGCLKFFL